MLDEQLAGELQADGTPRPPWVRHPELERYSLGWRMGYGESYLDLWWHWAAARSSDELTAYFWRHAPLPVEWADWVASALGLEVDPDEPAPAIERIAQAGLVDLAAWQRYWSTEPL